MRYVWGPHLGSKLSGCWEYNCITGRWTEKEKNQRWCLGTKATTLASFCSSIDASNLCSMVAWVFIYFLHLLRKAKGFPHSQLWFPFNSMNLYWESTYTSWYYGTIPYGLSIWQGLEGGVIRSLDSRERRERPSVYCELTVGQACTTLFILFKPLNNQRRNHE